MTREARFEELGLCVPPKGARRRATAGVEPHDQRRAEGIAAIKAVITEWATNPDSIVYPFDQTDLADRLFDLQPAYCPYDCSGCHDDECPCDNCATPRRSENE